MDMLGVTAVKKPNKIIEIGINAIKEYTDMQQGDVKETLADNRLLKDLIGEIPQVSLENGTRKFIEWYKSFYHE